MEQAYTLVLVLQLGVPLLILRFSLAGILASMLLDVLNTSLVQLLGGHVPYPYDPVDKLLDMYYLSLAAIVSLRWDPLPRRTSLALYGMRLVGVVLFEATQVRRLLVFFPNVFEMWFVFWAARNRFFPALCLTPRRLAWVLLALAIPKLAHEYVLHWARLCEKEYVNACGLEEWGPLRPLFGWLRR